MRTAVFFMITTEQLTIVCPNFVTINKLLFLLTYLIALILALTDKTLLNHHVGGYLWEFYIGNLEIGIWMFSFVNDESSPELEHINSAEQKERRHITRVSNIVRNLKDKLSRFPERDDPEFKSLEKGLHQEARELFLEPNGKELLSLLGKIYVSRSLMFKTKSGSSEMNVGTHLSRLCNKAATSSMFTKLYSGIQFIYTYLMFSIKNGSSGMKQDEVKSSFNSYKKKVYTIKIKYT
jgi:hypothetical protein